MSSGGGSTTTSTAELPSWLQDAAKSNLQRADYVSKLGYVPQYGIDVAGFSPMQQSAMQNTANAASAFGLQAPTDAMAGMPEQQTNNLGFSGYSSGDLYSGYLGNLANVAPAQYGAMRGMFIDPVTGDLGTSFSPTATTTNTGAVVSAPAAGLYGYGGNYQDSSQDSPSMWAAGTGNIEGGNQMGYAGNPWVQAGMGLKGISDVPVLGSGMLGLFGNIAGDAMIGYDTENIAGAPTITTRGSFDPMTFSDATPTDISGGAMGSNVARNNAGDAVSIGYGYGQIDPRIAEAAGFSIDPSFNAAPAPQVSTFADGSRSVVSTDPATAQETVTYYNADGTQLGSYNRKLGGLTLTNRNADGFYEVPDFGQIQAEEQNIARQAEVARQSLAAAAARQAAARQAGTSAAAAQSSLSGAYSGGNYNPSSSSGGGYTGGGSSYGANPSSTISGGSGRTDGGFGW